MEEEKMVNDDYYDEGKETSIISCSTSAGDFKMKLHKDWSPIGYERAVELFDRGFYDNSHFFRAVKNFLVQFGISYTQDKDLRKLARQTIKDDPQLDPPIKFEEGVISYAGSGPNSRSSHLFIAYGPIPSLGKMLWETPIGTVIEGMDTVKQFYSDYGDMPPWGKGPEQQKINNQGEKYILKNFPKLDKFIHCSVDIIAPTLDDKHEEAVEENVEAEKSRVEAEKSLVKAVNKINNDVAEIRGNPTLSTSKKVAGVMQAGIGHVAFPIAAAIVAFFVIMYILKRKGKKKTTNKTV